MKTIIAYAAAYLHGILLVTSMIGAAAFFLTWLVAGFIAFVSWSPSVIWIFWADIWVFVRISLALGFATSLLFILSKEGKEAVRDFVNDWKHK